MGYRECPTHGWIETARYTPNGDTGELQCDDCGSTVSGFRQHL